MKVVDHIKPRGMSAKKTTLTNIHYVDDYSAKKDSFRDFSIGMMNCVFGCNKSPCANLQPGHRVIIHARKGAQRRMVIGEVVERLDEEDPLCQVWAFDDGVMWKHNYSFLPLTPEFDYDKLWESKLREWCNQRDLSLSVLLSRCNDDYHVIVDQWIKAINDDLQQVEANDM